MDYINIRKKYKRLMCMIFMHSFMYCHLLFNWESCGWLKSNNKSKELNNTIIDISGDSHTNVKQGNNKKSTMASNVNNKNYNYNDNNNDISNNNDNNVRIGNQVTNELYNNLIKKDDIVINFDKKSDNYEDLKDKESVQTSSTHEKSIEIYVKNKNKNQENNNQNTKNNETKKRQLIIPQNTEKKEGEKANLITTKIISQKTNTQIMKVNSINHRIMSKKRAKLTTPKESIFKTFFSCGKFKCQGQELE